MKNNRLTFVIATTLLLSAASGTHAASGSAALTSPSEAGTTTASINPASLARAQLKLAHAVQVANHFAGAAAAEGLNERWRSEMINTLMSQPESTFDSVQSKGSVQDAMVAALSATTSGASDVVAKNLGDGTDDLTYIPLPSPCRIVDTRSGGGPLVAGTPRNFSFTNTNASQGGSGCTPFTGYVNGGAPGAAAINITVIGGGSAVPGSYLQAYPGGGSTTTSWLNFGPNQIIANEGILGISSFTFTLVTNATADAIVDVFGSFTPPHATAFNCVVVGTATGSTSVDSAVSAAANSNTFYTTASCPAGYTVQTPYCWNQSQTGVYASGQGVTGGNNGVGGGAFCAFINLNSTAVNVTVGTSCCRIGGRTN